MYTTTFTIQNFIDTIIIVPNQKYITRKDAEARTKTRTKLYFNTKTTLLDFGLVTPNLGHPG
jgi:hypothetical protein